MASDALVDLEAEPEHTSAIDPARKNEKDGQKKAEDLTDNATPEEAEAALTLLRIFLDAWKEGKFDIAEALVDERFRLSFRKEMEQKNYQVL